MNYTEKYHLPQWEKTDRILMDDFNRMCADMEAGLGKTAADAAAAAAKASASAANAQATANTAVSKADAARTVADAAYSPDQPPYVIGSYLGQQTFQQAAELTLHVGFKPSFVLVTGGGASFQLAAGPDTSCSNHLVFTDGGFTVKRHFVTTISGTTEQVPYLLHPDIKYQYIAFR